MTWKEILYGVIVVVNIGLCVYLEVWGNKNEVNKINVLDLLFDLVVAVVPVVHLLTLCICIYTSFKKEEMKGFVSKVGTNRKKQKRDK